MPIPHAGEGSAFFLFNQNSRCFAAFSMTGRLFSSVWLQTGENRDDGLLHFTCDPCLVLANVNVDLTPHSEFGQVDSRLNRKASARDDLAVVPGLEIIHIRPIAVDVFAD